ncbi:hypothetical protein Dimus_003037 [Dionaea muscipula]
MAEVAGSSVEDFRPDLGGLSEGSAADDALWPSMASVPDLVSSSEGLTSRLGINRVVYFITGEDDGEHVVDLATQLELGAERDRELGSAMVAGVGASTDDDRGAARVYDNIERLPTDSQVSNDGVVDELGRGSGVDGDVLCSSSSPVSSSPLPPVDAAVSDKGDVACLLGECGQRHSYSGLRFGPLVSGSEDRAAGFLAGKQVVADVVQQVSHVLADDELVVVADCVQHGSDAMVLPTGPFCSILPCVPSVFSAVDTAIDSGFVREEVRVSPTARGALRPQPTDGLWQPPSSPVEPVSERVEKEKGIHGDDSGTQKVQGGVQCYDYADIGTSGYWAWWKRTMAEVAGSSVEDFRPDTGGLSEGSAADDALWPSMASVLDLVSSSEGLTSRLEINQDGEFISGDDDGEHVVDLAP